MSPNREGNFGGSMNSSHFSSNLAEIVSDSHSVAINTSHDHNGYQNGSNMNGHNNISINGNGNGNGMNREKFESLSTGGPQLTRYGPNSVAPGSMMAVNINASENNCQNYQISHNNMLGAGGIESNTNATTSAKQNGCCTLVVIDCNNLQQDNKKKETEMIQNLQEDNALYHKTRFRICNTTTYKIL